MAALYLDEAVGLLEAAGYEVAEVRITAPPRQRGELPAGQRYRVVRCEAAGSAGEAMAGDGAMAGGDSAANGGVAVVGEDAAGSAGGRSAAGAAPPGSGCERALAGSRPAVVLLATAAADVEIFAGEKYSAG
ncbi:MAG: hypothetical protein LBJ10_07815 [Clostridiales bacterium]|nr:hypothetical protein [Clostridiales bacterium]